MENSVSTNKKKILTVKNIAQIALAAAIICVLGPLSIPIGPVPVSLTPFAVYLAVVVLGKYRGTIATLIYLLIGLAGVPVFSGFSGGPAKLFGPTGGYLVTFFITAFIAGIFCDKFEKFLPCFLGCLLGLAVLYFVGTVWFMVGMSMKGSPMGLWASLMACVIPFVPFDCVKIALAIILGKKIRGALNRADI